VECSHNKESQQFCEKHQIKGYPVLKLFTGTEVITYDREVRTIVEFDAFFTKTVEGYKSSHVTKKQQKGAQKAEARVTTTPTRSTVAVAAPATVAAVSSSSPPSLSSSADRLTILEQRIAQLEKILNRLEHLLVNKADE